jgi:hypothetical protein
MNDKVMLQKAIRELLDAMDMQEKRETGEFHITQESAKYIWDSAKAFAEIALEHSKK